VGLGIAHLVQHALSPAWFYKCGAIQQVGELRTLLLLLLLLPAPLPAVLTPSAPPMLGARAVWALPVRPATESAAHARAAVDLGQRPELVNAAGSGPLVEKPAADRTAADHPAASAQRVAVGASGAEADVVRDLLPHLCLRRCASASSASTRPRAVGLMVTLDRASLPRLGLSTRSAER